jgi:Saccharopine dehydrogenase NADP binding domain
MNERMTVAVVGAAGHTARFVLAELERRGRPALPLGRDVELDDPQGLARALGPAGAVINCAGPFFDTAAPVAAAAVSVGAHYFDVCAEQVTTRATLDAHDAQDSVVVAPAFAFFGGLADLLATAALDGASTADAIYVGVALDSWHPTRGTRLTGERNTAPRLVVSGGELVPADSAPPSGVERWEFPAPFGAQEVTGRPHSEIVTMAHHLRAAEIRSFMNHAPLEDLRSPETPAPQAADASGRSAQLFCMDARVRSGGEERRAIAAGRDIYAITAPLVVEGAERALAGRALRSGAGGAGELFDAEELLRALEPHGLELTLP